MLALVMNCYSHDLLMSLYIITVVVNQQQFNICSAWLLDGNTSTCLCLAGQGDINEFNKLFELYSYVIISCIHGWGFKLFLVKIFPTPIHKCFTHCAMQQYVAMLWASFQQCKLDWHKIQVLRTKIAWLCKGLFYNFYKATKNIHLDSSMGSYHQKQTQP